MSKIKFYNNHHRKPRSLGGDSSERNISVVCQAQHSAWHRLFDNYTPYRIAAIINTIWLDADYELVVRKKGCGSCTYCENMKVSST